MNDTTDKTAGFALIKQARALISGVNASLAESSRKQYEAAFGRMKKRDATPEMMAGTARSFYYFRAAWVHHYATEIREILNAADRSQRAGSVDDWQELVSKLPSLIQELNRYPPDPLSKNLADGKVGQWAVEAEKRSAAGQKIVSHSKRTRLRGLPGDWREQMFAGLRKGSKYQDIVAVLSATGARPEEFVEGIKVTIGEFEALHFDIGGAKTHNGKYGQEERSFDVSVNRPELQYLWDRLRANNGVLVVKAAAGALSDKVRQLSQKVFPQLKKTVSAYVFRHQMSADLKASGIPDAEVSAALGHSVDETKGYYGAAQSARGTTKVSNIRSSRIVRELTKEKIKKIERTRNLERQHERQR